MSGVSNGGKRVSREGEGERRRECEREDTGVLLGEF